MAAATRRGIPVVHTQGVSPHGVAEYALAAMVTAHRDIVGMHTALLSGAVPWRTRPQDFAATELTGTAIGVVGYGHIGQRVARMASAAYEADVLVFDPHLGDPSSLPGPVEVVGSLNELCERSLSVTLHCPLTDATRGMIGARQLELLGPDGVLVNAARGGIVDTPSLCAALRAGTLKGAVVDVFDGEPPSASMLAELAATPRLVVTPHVAGVTHQGNERISLSVVEDVLAALRGERPRVLANREVLG
ncbi:hypothetical protein NQ152_12615 [Microbacterium sp. zg.B48]|nr:NAD(P)-dependent oxidoreductase [Microbacterium sp. zg.B48]MCR2764346.1 hypothetical protein [Microbacterium sp. zg.B48]